MAEPLSKKSHEEAHEERDVNVRAVAGFGLCLAICVIMVFIAMRLMLGILVKHRINSLAPSETTEQAASPPEPRLQSDPAADLASFRQQQNDLLDSYGWIDRGAGVVRIPIERAMDLIVQRELLKTPPDIIGKTPLQMRQDYRPVAKGSP